MSQANSILSTRKLPFGVQSFKQLREGNYVYIDKTDVIWKVAHGPVSQFIARPRRFGKSLMISTLKSYFQGDGHLFEGLKVEQLRAAAGETEWVKHPTFFFGFSSSSYNQKSDVYNICTFFLQQYEKEYQLPSEGPLGKRMLTLIRTAYQQTGIKPVILVDEYDNPITDTITPDQQELHLYYKSELRGFYKAIKESGEFLHMVVVTGITQFAELSLFSGANSILNQTFNPEYAALCGITEEELKEGFRPEIEELAERENTDFEGAVKILRGYYDGYRFTSAPLHVYNPQSLIYCFYQHELSNNWSETGMSALLATVFPSYTFDFHLLTRDIIIHKEDLKKLDFTGRNPIPLLFQSGYLTIKDYDTRSLILTLAFPNHEVVYNFWNVLLDIFSAPRMGLGYPGRPTSFQVALMRGSIDAAMGELLALIAGIPYSAVGQQRTQPLDQLPNEEKREEARAKVYEQLFQVALYAWFAALGCDVRTEMHSLHGRSDVVLDMPEAIYIFELKLTQGQETGASALAQIKEKHYADPHRAKGKPIFGIGAAFDTRRDTRGECDWGWEEL
ncbi:MAG: hypothetical protein CSA97_04790 [Bacteroidetes bacterium]|nr:MAG: hypothetical protein CSA97_04790 [Bacteroidota bacterium]